MKSQTPNINFTKLIKIIGVFFICSVTAHAELTLYDDFSDGATSVGKWDQLEINDGQVRFGNDISRCNPGSWAYNQTGMAQLDCESSWSGDWCRMDRSTPVTISAGQPFTVRWLQRWAENPGWGLYAGFALLNNDKSAVATTNGEAVQAGHCGTPKDWSTSTSWRTYFRDWHHESPWQYDSYAYGPITMEMEISTTNIIIKSWTNSSWSGSADWTYNTGNGVAEGNYYPAFYIWSATNPAAEKSGIIAIDNIYFSDDPCSPPDEPVPAQSQHPPHLMFNGKPFFPHGWFLNEFTPIELDEGQYSYAQLSGDADMWYSRWRQQRFTSHLVYQLWCSDYGPWNWYSSAHQWAAGKHETPVIAELHRNITANPGSNTDFIVQQINYSKDFPGVLGWYMIDEPLWQGVTPEWMIQLYDLIKSTDPSRPVMAHFATDANDFLQHGRMCDILSAHSYPVGIGDPEFGSSMWSAAVKSRNYTKYTIDYNLDVYIDAPQAHSWRTELRVPTASEGRYLTYAPIIEGARGLYHWMWTYTSDNYRENVLPLIASEINYLIPAILSDSDEVQISSSRDSDTTGHGIEDITYLFGRGTEGGVLMAMNNTNSNLNNVVFTANGSILSKLHSGSTNIRAIFEDRNVQLQATADPNTWTFIDDFTPFEVHVYQLYDMYLYDDFGEIKLSNLRWTKDAGNGGAVYLEQENPNRTDWQWHTTIDLSSGSSDKFARAIAKHQFTIDAENNVIIRWRQNWESYQPDSYYGGIALTSTDYTTEYLDAGTQNLGASGDSNGRFYLEASQSSPINTTARTSHELIISTVGVTHNAWEDDGWDGDADFTATEPGLSAGTYGFRFYVWGAGGAIGPDNSTANRGVLHIDDVYTNVIDFMSSCDEIHYYGKGMEGDFNDDCQINLEDYSYIANQWLK